MSTFNPQQRLLLPAEYLLDINPLDSHTFTVMELALFLPHLNRWGVPAKLKKYELLFDSLDCSLLKKMSPTGDVGRLLAKAKNEIEPFGLLLHLKT